MALFAADSSSYNLLASATRNPVMWMTDNSVVLRSNSKPVGGGSVTLTTAICDIIHHKPQKVTVQKSSFPQASGDAYWSSGSPSRDPKVQAQYMSDAIDHKKLDATVFVDTNLTTQPRFYELGPNGDWLIVAIEPIIALAHELSHALNYIRGNTAVATGGGSVQRVSFSEKLPWGATACETVTGHELEALDFENQVRRELGRRERILYRAADAEEYKDWRTRKPKGTTVWLDSSRPAKRRP